MPLVPVLIPTPVGRVPLPGCFRPLGADQLPVLRQPPYPSSPGCTSTRPALSGLNVVPVLSRLFQLPPDSPPLPAVACCFVRGR